MRSAILTAILLLPFIAPASARPHQRRFLGDPPPAGLSDSLVTTSADHRAAPASPPRTSDSTHTPATTDGLASPARDLAEPPDITSPDYPAYFEERQRQKLAAFESQKRKELDDVRQDLKFKRIFEYDRRFEQAVQELWIRQGAERKAFWEKQRDDFDEVRWMRADAMKSLGTSKEAGEGWGK